MPSDKRAHFIICRSIISFRWEQARKHTDTQKNNVLNPTIDLVWKEASPKQNSNDKQWQALWECRGLPMQCLFLYYDLVIINIIYYYYLVVPLFFIN